MQALLQEVMPRRRKTNRCSPWSFRFLPSLAVTGTAKLENISIFPTNISGLNYSVKGDFSLIGRMPKVTVLKAHSDIMFNYNIVYSVRHLYAHVCSSYIVLDDMLAFLMLALLGFFPLFLKHGTVR